jgi:hypothetical protein
VPEVVLDADLGGVLHLLQRAAEDLGEAASLIEHANQCSRSIY